MLGLPSKHYYSSQRVLVQYGVLLKKLGVAFDVRDLEKVVSIEQGIQSSLTENAGSPEESYTAKSIEELKRTWKEVPWETLLLAWGMPTDLIRTSKFIVTNKTYIDHFNRLFRTFDLGTWRIWMQAYTILSFLEYLPSPFDTWHNDLFGHRLRGNTQKLPQYLVMLHVLQTTATQALSYEYVQKYIPVELKEEATSMVRRLKTATIQRIRNVPWMLASTKAIAVEKVKAMRFRVAYPSEWFDEFTGITVDPERLLQNIWNLNTKDTIRMIETLGRGCGNPGGKWDDGAFEVNAYYYPDKNQLVIPGGMLRTPFFDLKRSVAWNYGGIGAAIGHEITHAFDDDGRNYDVYGSYKEWWTDTDNKKYAEMSQDLISLFDGEEYEGGKVDGSLTLSENIADLGGVAIALSALQSYLQEHKASATEKKKAYRDFFLSYAVSWRNKDRPKKAKQSLFMDVHAPAHLRVNLIVRQFKEFFEAFDIAEGDPGWIPEKDRIRLW
jgi:predicted metalloendopeptidase